MRAVWLLYPPCWLWPPVTNPCPCQGGCCGPWVGPPILGCCCGWFCWFCHHAGGFQPFWPFPAMALLQCWSLGLLFGPKIQQATFSEVWFQHSGLSSPSSTWGCPAQPEVCGNMQGCPAQTNRKRCYPD